MDDKNSNNKTKSETNTIIPNLDKPEYFNELKFIITVIIDIGGENYTYNISIRNTFRELKKVIQVSLKIRRKEIIFYKKDGEEIKNCDDFCLSEIFPEEKKIHLKITISPKESEINSSQRKVYLNNYCPVHERKYLVLYCYTCEKSICIQCLEDSKHNEHNYMEKYDYLQNSGFLVEKSFKNITEEINKVKYLMKDNCDDLLKKNEEYFDSIIDMFKSLKLRTNSFISHYSEKSHNSFMNLKNNLNIIKDTCSETLEQLKEKLIFENLIACEETFLEFDHKYKILKEEENKIIADKNTYEDLINYFKTISDSFNNLYDDFKLFAFEKDQYCNLIINSNKIDELFVNEFSSKSRDEIKDKILVNVKEGYFKKSSKLENKTDKSINKPISINPSSELHSIFNKIYDNISSKIIEKSTGIENNINNLKMNNWNFPNITEFDSKVNLESDLKENINSKELEKINDLKSPESNNEKNNKKNEFEKKSEIDKMDIIKYPLENFNNIQIIKEESEEKESRSKMEELEKNSSEMNLNELLNKTNDSKQLLNPNNDFLKTPVKKNHGSEKIYDSFNCSCKEDLFKITKNKKINKFYIIVAPLPKTNKIRIYHEHILSKDEEIINKVENSHFNIETTNDGKNEVFSEFCELEVEFPKHSFSNKKLRISQKFENSSLEKYHENSQNLNYFLNYQATVNHVSDNDSLRKLKMYISGGFDFKNNTDSSKFMCLEFCDKTLFALPDMLQPRSYHSMIEHNNFLYVVGGKDNQSCEKYNIHTQEWTKLPDLKLGERRNSGLYVYHDCLYTFFGTNKTGVLDSVEKLHLKSHKSQWEIFSFKKEKNIDLKRYGFAFWENKYNIDQIHIFGGKNLQQKFLDKILLFDFKENKFIKTDAVINKDCIFKESKLIRLSDDNFGFFSNDTLDEIFRVKY